MDEREEIRPEPQRNEELRAEAEANPGQAAAAPGGGSSPGAQVGNPVTVGV